VRVDAKLSGEPSIMFKSKVLFIIGAGASCEANLPIGFELKNKIGKKLNLHSDFGSCALREGGDRDIFLALWRNTLSGR
jgi:hypothetical protein